MGQKVNALGFRLGYNKAPSSSWYRSKKGFARCILEDIKIRNILHAETKAASVGQIGIQREANKILITISSARPGVLIGRKGENIANLQKLISSKINNAEAEVFINTKEIRRPETNAKLVAESIAQQLERRIMFRRAMKKAIQAAMRLGAQGIKVQVSGRLGGAEIARSESLREGRVPLHTLKADIDYNTSEAKTTYGIVGVKVWIYKGDTTTVID